jgi:hypothetical protein
MTTERKWPAAIHLVPAAMALLLCLGCGDARDEGISTEAFSVPEAVSSDLTNEVTEDQMQEVIPFQVGTESYVADNTDMASEEFSIRDTAVSGNGKGISVVGSDGSVTRMSSLVPEQATH